MLTCNESQIQSLLDEKSPVVVMFSASWCGPCKVFKPKFEAASSENPDVTFAYCDIEETQGLSRDVSIQSVPTVVSFVNGDEDEKIVGPNEAKLKDFIQRLKQRVKDSAAG
jgi:thioredoxin 1